MTRTDDTLPRPGVGLVRAPLDADAILASVADPAAGGNILFLGTTRGVTDGAVTVGLEYEAHEPMALRMLGELREEATRQFGLSRCAVVHRLGPVAVGEASIAIATSAPHRRAAFAAAEWLLERIKESVPVWKCEEREGGARSWIHPTPGGGAAGGQP